MISNTGGISLGKSKKGRKVSSGMTSEISRAEKIQDVRETIKGNEYLQHYYQLLLDDAPENHLSFQSYLKEIDVRLNAVKEERCQLVATFAKANNGEIPSLKKQNEELKIKLKALRATLTPQRQAARREKKVAKIKVKAKTLREKLVALEQELRSDGFDLNETEPIIL